MSAFRSFVRKMFDEITEQHRLTRSVSAPIQLKVFTAKLTGTTIRHLL